MQFKDFYIKIGQPGAWSSSMSYPATFKPSWSDESWNNPFGVNEKFGIKVKHVPYKPVKEIKSPVVQEWKDEEGDDTFLPMNSAGAPSVVHQAFDLSVTFVYHKPAPENEDGDGGMVTVIDRLLSIIEGRWLKIYDTYTGIGYDGVYFAGFDDDPTFKKRSMETSIFTLKFHVNGIPSVTPLV